MPTKENHNGDKHATITKLVIFIVNIVRNYSWAHYSRLFKNRQNVNFGF